MYLDASGNVIENLSTVGYKSVGVPGSVAGLVYAEKKYGKLSLEKVIAPAIKLAREGFPLAYEDARAFMTDDFLSQFPDSRRIFQRNGKFYQPGEILKQPELAPVRSNASPRILTTSTTQPWPANSPPPDSEKWRPHHRCRSRRLRSIVDITGSSAL